MSTLAELSVEEILKSSDTTLNYLFPLLFESDLIFPSWIYHRVTMWWLKYNKDSIFDKMIGDLLEPSSGSINLDYFSHVQPYIYDRASLPEETGYFEYSFALYPESLVPTGSTNLDNF